MRPGGGQAQVFVQRLEPEAVHARAGLDGQRQAEFAQHAQDEAQFGALLGAAFHTHDPFARGVRPLGEVRLRQPGLEAGVPDRSADGAGRGQVDVNV